MLAGAVGLGVAAFFDPALVASPLFDKLLATLVIGGISMEVGAIADALTQNRGQNITTRQAASYRQIIYGEQRIGGVAVYRSTTGSSHDQFNFVIVVAGHQVDSLVNLYLDGRQVYWQGSGPGWSVRNGVGFGGIADGGNHTGPNGVLYNFGGTGHSGIYCEARFGDQSAGDVISGLTANDPNWAATSAGSPWVAGCAYIYLKVEANSNLFPGEPEIRLTVRGKNNIFDPRTGSKGFSTNWALVCADVITDTQFGLGDNTVNQAQLIAAANVCDELVETAPTGLGSEARYTCNYHYDTSTAPGDALQTMMPAAQGRLSRIGGEWYIWPAYWQGPSFSFSDANLTGGIEWKPYRSYRELFNRVNGTYIAPNFPWNIAGNLYDSNGFYDGMLQNNFPFAWQPTNYPQYALDVLHGYSSDEYLIQDTPNVGTWNSAATTPYNVGDVVLYNNGFYQCLVSNNSATTPDVNTADWVSYPGKQLPKELGQQCVISVAQAQRCAKIALLRNRQQGSGTFPMNLETWQAQPVDVIQFSYAENGWVNKLLEVQSVNFDVSTGNDQEAPSIRCKYTLIETDPSVYEWNTAEELTVYDVPSIPLQTPTTPDPPTGMSLLSSAATALVAPDGSIRPRIEVQWTPPYDVQTKQIQVQYQQVGSSSWTDNGMVDVSLSSAYISNVIAGQAYNVQIRGIRPATGAFSPWVQVLNFTAGLVLNSLGRIGVGVGSLIAEGYSDGTGGIECTPFTAYIGQLALPIFPSGSVQIYTDGTIGGTGGSLAQQKSYYVYYYDPTNVGGNVTPIATTNISDFLGKPGYWLIDSATTLYNSSSGGTGGGGGGGGTTVSRYYPSNYSSTGSRSTVSPANAYDGNLSTYALVSGYGSWNDNAGPIEVGTGGGGTARTGRPQTTSGQCLFEDFPSHVTTTAMNLTVIAQIAISGSEGGSCVITGIINGTNTVMESATSSVGSATYLLTVPAGTDISTVSVLVSATPVDSTGDGDTNSVSVSVAEIYIQ